MKRLLTIAAAVTLIISCGKGQSQQNATDNPSTTTDIANTDNSDTNYQQDSINEVSKVTYDLAAMEVRGSVKKIVVEGSTVITFDEKGTMTSYSDEGSDYMLCRDDDGNLGLYASGTGTNYYYINPDTDQLVQIVGGEGTSLWKANYNYDADGQLISIEEIWEDVSDDTTTKSTDKVTVLQTDRHGNWLKRKVGDQTQWRTIVYYANPLGGDDEDDTATKDKFHPQSKAYTFKGTIGGDTDATLCLEGGGQGYYEIAMGQRFIFLDSYNTATDTMILSAYKKTGGDYLGRFDGTYKDGTYKGVFTNNAGAKVSFDLHLVNTH